MNKRNRVVVAMSGGVDSSVAACLLQEQGYEVVGFFMRTGVGNDRAWKQPDRHQGCCSAADASDARYVAGKLGISFYALNMQEDFERIVDYFADEYAAGRTPNPCVVCNDALKFGKLYHYARSIDADMVATGHYARIGQRGNRRIIRRAVDLSKDQSYFLFGLNPAMIERILLPIGEMDKSEVRTCARRFGLPVHNKPDSVEICFVPDRDYAGVVRSRRPDAFQSGEVVDGQGKVVGYHEGVGNFTIGQRRGLGIALGLPVYVTHLDSNHGRVTVGTRSDLLSGGLIADGVNWMIDRPDEPLRVRAKIRYQHDAASATVTCLDSARIRVIFDDPQTAIAPGQAVVLYDGQDCLGGGWIRQAVEEDAGDAGHGGGHEPQNQTAKS